MVNARVLSVCRYKNTIVKKVYYFRDILYLFKIGDDLRVSTSYDNVKRVIDKK